MNAIPQLAVSAYLLLAVSCIPHSPSRVLKTVTVTAPTIISFMPPSLLDSTAEGADEAVAHLRFAVEDTVKCLHPMELQTIVVYADEVSLRSGKASEHIQLRGRGQAIGGIIVEPNRKALVVVSENGPSTLLHLLPTAASKYWNVKSGQH